MPLGFVSLFTIRLPRYGCDYVRSVAFEISFAFFWIFRRLLKRAFYGCARALKSQRSVQGTHRDREEFYKYFIRIKSRAHKRLSSLN